MNRVTLYSNGTGVFDRVYTLKDRQPLNISIPIRNDSLDEAMTSLGMFGQALLPAKKVLPVPCLPIKRAIEIIEKIINICLIGLDSIEQACYNSLYRMYEAISVAFLSLY